MSDLFSEQHEKQLVDLADALASAYRTNTPFPHIVIDDFLPADVIDRVVADCPGPEHLPWIEFDKEHEKKLTLSDLAHMPTSIREVLQFMSSSIMLRFLERMTEIENLIPDPYFAGGGLHHVERGGYLDVHVDFNKHPLFDLDRRLNVLVYLNKDWRDEYGGHLELWDARMETCVRRVLPIFNRCVVFSTTETSYHGHPEPLSCPEHRSRRVLTTYYYTNGRPQAEQAAEHSTIFRARRGIDDTPRKRVAALARRALTAVTPPILVDAYRKLTR